MGSEQYRNLVEACGEVLYGDDKAGLPVYALIDQEALDAIASKIGLEGDPRAAFISLVRETLNLDETGVGVFRSHLEAARTHAETPWRTPWSLPLFMVLSWAAENMQADEKMSSNNYYGRLFGILDVPEERRKQFEIDYRKNAEQIWATLNSWLESWEGDRGIPTAYAVGNLRFVGLAVSQAVVRLHDRAGLHEVFADEGLTPGAQMGEPEMEAILDAYASKVPSPLSVNLRQSWKDEGARARIVQAAILELAAWNGQSKEKRDGALRLSVSRLVAYLHSFPRPKIKFDLMMPGGSQESGTATFSISGRNVEFPVEKYSALSTAVHLRSAEDFDPKSLVGNELKGYVGPEQGPRIERKPRRVVPLRWDELQNAYLEVERIGLGERCLILCQEDVITRLTNYLQGHARPGWVKSIDLTGVPVGWCVFRDVQILRTPESEPHADLNPLVPRATKGLGLSGGFALPGRLRKYSSMQPPEIVAIAEGANRISVTVFEGFQQSTDEFRFAVESEDEQMVVNLEKMDLKDGDYTVAMFVDGGKKAVATCILRLRSSATPTSNVLESDLRLVYSPSSGVLWPIVADQPASADVRYVNGPRVEGWLDYQDLETPKLSIEPFRPRPHYTETKRPTVENLIQIGEEVSLESCLFTGSHFFNLGKTDGRRPENNFVQVPCQGCGLIKRLAVTPWAAKKRKKKQRAVYKSVVRDIQVEALATDRKLDLSVVADAVFHVGYGNSHSMERIVSHVDDSASATDKWLRGMEIAGHIDVRRDKYLEVQEWAVNASTLMPVDSGLWSLIGFRSAKLVSELREILGVETTTEYDAGHSLFGGILFEAPDDLVMSHIDRLNEISVTALEDNPAVSIASKLPQLSQVEAELHRMTAPITDGLERWNSESATWQQSTSIEVRGAFRIREHGSTYFVRSVKDLENNTIGLGNAQIVKHIANSWDSDPLLSYEMATNSAIVPLGADLPGLYGRALVLSSGKAPKIQKQDRLLAYHHVPKHLAEVVLSKLMN